MQRNTAFKAAFQLYNAASGAMATGIGNTCTIAFNLDGTNQSTGSITEIANGDYYVSATAANANGATGFITGSSNVSGIVLSGTRYDFGDAINQYSLSVTNGQVIGTSTLTQAQVTGYAGPILTDNSTGLVKASLVAILGTALTETVVGYLTAAFKKFFNVVTPTATADTMATLANQTTIINAVNGITTNTARSAPRVPEFLARPASGSVAYTGDLYLYNLQGQLEDADSNTITVHARNAAGTSLDAGLTSTTMTRVSAGFYRMTYTVNSTDTAQAVYFDFSWAIASVAMRDGAATEVQDAANYPYLVAIKAKTDAIGTNAADSPNAGTAQTTIGTLGTLATGAGFNISTGSQNAFWSILTSVITTGGSFGALLKSYLGGGSKVVATLNAGTDLAGSAPLGFFTNSPSGGGGTTGAYTVPVQWIDGANNPVPNVAWIIPGQGAGVSDGNGTAAGQITLNNGTYAINSVITNGIAFPAAAIVITNGVPMVNGSTSNFNISGTAIQIPTPSAGQVTVFGFCYDIHNVLESEVSISVQLVGPSIASILPSNAVTLTSDSNGMISIELPPNQSFKYRRGSGPLSSAFNTGAGPNFQLEPILGKD